ncbi:MAG: glycosyltransferase, partial [Flavobacteriales bacterium]
DTDFFSSESVNDRKDEKEKLMRGAGIENNDLVVTYIGSLKTWYLPEKVFSLMKKILDKRSDAKFLFITHETRSYIEEWAEQFNINKSNLIIKAAQRKDMPLYISMSSFSVFFIKPVFSKRASSPTKMGELMALGVPYIANSGVGDVKWIAQNYQVGMILDNFKEETMQNAVNNMEQLINANSEKLVEAAKDFYSLKKGVNTYYEVYKRLNEV